MPKLNKVLLIDDGPTANFLHGRIVRSLGICREVKVLTGGRQAMAYLIGHCGPGQQSCPERIILDHHMPDMDGMELMVALQGNGILKNMKAVFLLLAIHSSQKDIARFRELGVQEFTRKPSSRETLLEACRKYWADDTVQGHTG